MCHDPPYTCRSMQTGVVPCSLTWVYGKCLLTQTGSNTEYFNCLMSYCLALALTRHPWCCHTLHLQLNWTKKKVKLFLSLVSSKETYFHPAPERHELAFRGKTHKHMWRATRTGRATLLAAYLKIVDFTTLVQPWLLVVYLCSGHAGQCTHMSFHFLYCSLYYRDTHLEVICTCWQGTTSDSNANLLL